jgi:hypothetical protein
MYFLLARDGQHIFGNGANRIGILDSSTLKILEAVGAFKTRMEILRGTKNYTYRNRLTVSLKIKLLKNLSSRVEG